MSGKTTGPDQYILQLGITIVMIEHDMGLVMRISDHIVVWIAGGRSPTDPRKRSGMTSG